MAESPVSGPTATDAIGVPATERVTVDMTVNGGARTVVVEARETLADVLRERLGLTGLKVSCDVQVCGACTVLVDGLAVSACTYLAADATGHDVLTVEGLARDGRLSPLQQAFIDAAAFQCGFCTPGMLMTATALLQENPTPSRDEVVAGIGGNLCRCTGYVPIVDAVLAAAAAGPNDGSTRSVRDEAGPAGSPASSGMPGDPDAPGGATRDPGSVDIQE